MATKRTTRLKRLAATILGREPTGEASPPRTGTDTSSMRHMLALIIGTAEIMVFGVIVAVLDDGESDGTNATPTVGVTTTTVSGS
jgi:hypothetical protein